MFYTTRPWVAVVPAAPNELLERFPCHEQLERHNVKGIMKCSNQGSTVKLTLVPDVMLPLTEWA
jgi:hypothetical protein